MQKKKQEYLEQISLMNQQNDEYSIKNMMLKEKNIKNNNDIIQYVINQTIRNRDEDQNEF